MTEQVFLAVKSCAATQEIEMSTALPRLLPDVERMDQDRGTKMLDRQSQKRLGIPGAEFVRRYRAGELKDFNQATVLDLAMLLPFAGESMNGRKHL